VAVLIGLVAAALGIWRALAERPAERWARVLRGASRAEDRWQAARSLLPEESPGEERIAVRALIGALRDPDRIVRRTAAGQLGRYGMQHEDVVAALVVALGDDDAAVRRAILGALGAHVRAFGAWPPKVERAVRAALADREARVRLEAAYALIGAGDAAATVPILIAATRDGDPFVRGAAIEGLGMLSPTPQAAAPALVERLDDRDPAIRTGAAVVLSRIAPGRAVPALIASLRESDFALRREAARALGKLGPEARAAIPALMAMAREAGDDDNDDEDANRYTRQEAGSALRMIGAGQTYEGRAP
jgi:HEAT repeat protein